MFQVCCYQRWSEFRSAGMEPGRRQRWVKLDFDENKLFRHQKNEASHPLIHVGGRRRTAGWLPADVNHQTRVLGCLEHFWSFHPLYLYFASCLSFCQMWSKEQEVCQGGGLSRGEAAGSQLALRQIPSSFTEPRAPTCSWVSWRQEVLCLNWVTAETREPNWQTEARLFEIQSDSSKLKT